MSDEQVNDEMLGAVNGKPLTARQKKLASALRQNLLKRKQQQRERVAQEISKDADDVS